MFKHLPGFDHLQHGLSEVQAKKVLKHMFEHPDDSVPDEQKALDAAKKLDFVSPIDDYRVLYAMFYRILAENPSLADLPAEKATNFMLGQMLQRSNYNVHPDTARKVIERGFNAATADSLYEWCEEQSRLSKQPSPEHLGNVWLYHVAMDLLDAVPLQGSKR
jgi:hypothetical protein